MLAGEKAPNTAMSITTGGTSAKWDSQRKEAKSLENTLDTLLASLSSKASSYTAATATGESSEGSVKATEISDLERKVEESLAKVYLHNYEIKQFFLVFTIEWLAYSSG